jgi:hypothetical protein
MIEQIKTDNNCIVKAFENNPISIIEEDIIEEDINTKKLYCFKASDIGKVLGILNIRQSIQNYEDDERVVRKIYDPKVHFKIQYFYQVKVFIVYVRVQKRK